MDLWRISEYISLDGEGGRLADGRWNSTGNPIVYLAASPPGALIEVLVHLELDEDDFPPIYNLLRINVPPSLSIRTIRVPAGDGWKATPALTRKLGDAWLKSQRCAIARVPSAIVPKTFNCLLNPLHRDAHRVRVAEVSARHLRPSTQTLAVTLLTSVGEYAAANTGATSDIT